LRRGTSDLAKLYSLAGDKDRAFYWLEDAYRRPHSTGADGLFWLKGDPTYAVLRSDPRYSDLLRRVGVAAMSAIAGLPGNGMNGRFQIGEWRAEPGLNTLSQNGSPIRLEPKIMEVLVCLASHAGEPVPKGNNPQSGMAGHFRLR